MKKTHPEYLLPQRELGEQNTTLDILLKPKVPEIMALQNGGRMEHSWCPCPSLVGMGRFVEDTFIPQCCLDRDVEEDPALKQVGLGHFREVTEAVGGAPHLWVWGTALALEDIPQLTGEVWKAGALACQKLSSQSRSSCQGGMRQHCALKSIPTLSARDEIS